MKTSILSPVVTTGNTENEASRRDALERRLRRYSEGAVAQVGGTVCHVIRTVCMRTTQVTMLLSHGAMAQDDANLRICVTERLVAHLAPWTRSQHAESHYCLRGSSTLYTSRKDLTIWISRRYSTVSVELRKWAAHVWTSYKFYLHKYKRVCGQK